MPIAPSERTGLALPAVKLNGGYFAPRTGADVAWGDLIIAAFTPIGGRFMRRDAGGALVDYVMAPLDEALGSAVREAIITAVARQCPHIRIRTVDVKSTRNSTVDLSISFALSTSPTQVDTRLVRLDRRMIGNILRISRGL